MTSDPRATQSQRLWPRWLVAGSKRVRADLGPAGACPLVDIGGGGMRVQALAPLRRGAEIPVRIDVPDTPDVLQCSGIVVWSKPNGAAGIRFAGLSEIQKKILNAWLAELERAAINPSTGQRKDEFTSVVSQIRAAQLNNADALNAIVRRVKELPGVSGAALALGTPENMICMAAAGTAPEVGSSIPAVIGLTGECVFKRKMIYCQDAKRDPRVGRELNFGSVVILPLVVNNEVRGVLEVFSAQANAFDPSTIDSLEKLADAVVFVTYGIVTQRRLSTAKATLPGPSASLGPKHPPGLSSLTDSWLAPDTTFAKPGKREDEGAGTSSLFEVPVASARPQTVSASVSPAVAPEISPVRPVPLRSSASVAALAAPAVSRKAVVVESLKQAPSSSRVRRKAAHSSRVKWIAAVMLVVSMVSVWYFVGRQRTVFTAVASTSPVNMPVQQARFSASASSEPTSVKANVGPALMLHEDKRTSETPKHERTGKQDETRIVESPSAQPAPIILSASTGPATNEEEGGMMAAPASIPNPAGMPQFSLPSDSSVPKLAAPTVRVRTGGALLKKVEPVYPLIAKTARIQGNVELRFVIQKDGTVAHIETVSGLPILAGAAVDAVKQWRYDPVKINDQPVEMPMTVTLKFDLYR